MRINFTYDRDKDIWCLLNKGKSSSHSQNPTKQYTQLVQKYGENPTTESVGVFIDEYITENHIDIKNRIAASQADWERISSEFQKRAEAIFGVVLPQDLTAYLTINSRCPYSIENNFFYVSLQSSQAIQTTMHELWHFYTWYGLGSDQEERLGHQKYNDIKEALTVLLNVECKDLLPEGVVDKGYPQHAEMRQKIAAYWEKDKNIKNVWGYITASF